MSMDYEKAYKELVAQIRKAYLYAQTNSTKAVLEDILPDLSKIDDNKIRLEILDFFKTNMPGVTLWIAWLEKQKEQKPAEWSEKDEEMIDYAYGLCYNAHETAHSAQDANKATKCMSWLKSLRPQPCWMPSMDEMEALNEAINEAASSESMHENDWRYNSLRSLRERIKKVTKQV